MRRLLRHDALGVRFLTLLGAALAIFIATWLLSYHLLPEGVLRGRSGAAALAGDDAADSLLPEFLRIALINAFMVAIIVAANRLLAVKGVPLGYITPLMLAASYAATLGTNSFTIPLPQRMAPSFAVLTRSGPYEIAAYILVAASTHALPTNVYKGLFPPDSEPIAPRPDFMSSIDWRGLLLATALLLAANLWEAYQIMTL